MYIKELEIVNFRNYISQKAVFSRGVNVLYGNNGQGKTNLLEAVFLCSVGKSYRGVPDRELIRHGCKYASVCATVGGAGRDYVIEAVISDDKRKRIKVNGVRLERASQLIGIFNSVLFTPDDMQLILGGPSLRRRMLDIFISQLRPVYLSSLISYNRALEQKSRLLRSLGSRPSLAGTLSVWNSELAGFGAVIVKYRAEYLKKLSRYIGRIHSDITGACESSLINYACNVKVPLDSKIEDIKASFFEQLQRAADREIEQKNTLIGPHRDDMLFCVQQNKAKNFASRGQCRTVVLSLRLAQLEVFKQEKGEYPVLLLDDITSELDSGRRHYLFEKINGMQAIITCTDAGLIGHGYEARYFHIENGSIT